MNTHHLGSEFRDGIMHVPSPRLSPYSVGEWNLNEEGVQICVSLKLNARKNVKKSRESQDFSGFGLGSLA